MYVLTHIREHAFKSSFNIWPCPGNFDAVCRTHKWDPYEPRNNTGNDCHWQNEIGKCGASKILWIVWYHTNKGRCDARTGVYS